MPKIVISLYGEDFKAQIEGIEGTSFEVGSSPYEAGWLLINNNSEKLGLEIEITPDAGKAIANRSWHKK